MSPALALTEPEVVLPPGPGTPDELRPLPGGAIQRIEGEAIGTGWRVTMVLDDPARMDAGAQAMSRALHRVVQAMSQWEPDSELSRYNAAPAGTATILSPAFAHVLDCALTIADLTGGAFDPALGQASEAWGFGASGTPGRPPAPAQHARAHDWRAIAFDPERRSLMQPGALALDLCGIAKGFAVDLCSAFLSRAGIHHHLVEIGGELRGRGVRPDGQPWWIEVEPPPGHDTAPVRIALSGWSAATSGDWARRRGDAAHSWSHTLSPESGAPTDNGLRAATVLHRGCMQADALATAMMVLDPAQGLALADRYAIPARLVHAGGRTTMSTAWRAML